MLNILKFRNRIEELEYYFALVQGEIKPCHTTTCYMCEFYDREENGSYDCSSRKTDWLLSEEGENK